MELGSAQRPLQRPLHLTRLDPAQVLPGGPGLQRHDHLHGLQFHIGLALLHRTTSESCNFGGPGAGKSSWFQLSRCCPFWCTTNKEQIKLPPRFLQAPGNLREVTAEHTPHQSLPSRWSKRQYCSWIMWSHAEPKNSDLTMWVGLMNLH